MLFFIIRFKIGTLKNKKKIKKIDREKPTKRHAAFQALTFD